MPLCAGTLVAFIVGGGCNEGRVTRGLKVVEEGLNVGT